MFSQSTTIIVDAKTTEREERLNQLQTLPDELLCPISLELLVQPVLTTQGQVYSDASLKEVIKEAEAKGVEPRCGITRERLVISEVNVSPTLNTICLDYAAFLENIENVVNNDDDYAKALSEKAALLARFNEEKAKLLSEMLAREKKNMLAGFTEFCHRFELFTSLKVTEFQLITDPVVTADGKIASQKNVGLEDKSVTVNEVLTNLANTLNEEIQKTLRLIRSYKLGDSEKCRTQFLDMMLFLVPKNNDFKAMLSTFTAPTSSLQPTR